LAVVARLTEIAEDIGAVRRALANAKIHSNAAHPNISTGSSSDGISNVEFRNPKQSRRLKTEQMI
jgi:hypothetical protein